MGKTVAILANLDPSGYADMTAIAASSTAMAAIAASATARAAICASTVAYDYLLSKATYATISGTYSSMGWSTRYEKPCIVLQWCFSHNGGTVGIRTCLDGAASRTYQGSQRYNSSMGSGNFNSNAKVSGTYYKEFVFCSKLETYNSQSDWPAIMRNSSLLVCRFLSVFRKSTYSHRVFSDIPRKNGISEVHSTS